MQTSSDLRGAIGDGRGTVVVAPGTKPYVYSISHDERQPASP